MAVPCEQYEWCKERLGVDPMKRQYGREPLCWRCANFDYMEAQRERLGPPPEEQPVHRLVLRGELTRLKGEINYITNRLNEHMGRHKKKKDKL